MGSELTTAQKAKIIVTDPSNGQPVTGFTPAVHDGVGLEGPDANGDYWALGGWAPGGPLDVAKAGRTGHLDIVVTDAPFTVDLGAPVPK